MTWEEVMDKSKPFSVPVDSVSILFLSLMRREHTNCFRLAVDLKEPVDPAVLQQAVDIVWRRLPTVIGCIKPGFFHFRQVHAEKPPQICPDPGLLKTMTREELESCAFRVFYKKHTLSFELFHVLSDGFGAITTMVTLVSEYLRLKYGVEIPVSALRLDAQAEPSEWETEDSFLPLAKEKPWHFPSRFSYLPPKPADTNWTTRVSALKMDTKPLLDAAHHHGVTLNSLLSAVMASAIMEMQLKYHPDGKLKPVRLMIPVNMRRMFGSVTLRNFALYGLPTMEPEDRKLGLTELCRSFDTQIKEQLTKEKLAAMGSYNVRMQNAWFFRILPWKLKGAAMRIGYRFFGESNSSLTLTNLGRVALPQELMEYVTDFQVYMTPRAGVPYGCTVVSYGNQLTLNISKFTDDTELEEVFFGKLQALANGKDHS